MKARAILARLVGFPTVSGESNLECVDWIRGLLERQGWQVRLSFDEQRAKANLLARIGPEAGNGVLLSGHTDVVPVDGQHWTSDPFTLTERDGRLFGRGSVDMKGFIACCLEAVLDLNAAGLRRPVFLALSYDEEFGCIGVPGLVSDLLVSGWALPSLAIIGEPTSLRVATAHKGVFVGRATFRGRAVHSSDPRKGIDAIAHAFDFIEALRRLARELTRDRSALDLDPPFTTFNVGLIEGGTALNIVPSSCTVTFEFRPIPEADGRVMWQKLAAKVEAIGQSLRMQSAEAGASIERVATVLPLHADEGERLLRVLTGRNEPAVAVPFGTDAGYFQHAGMPAVVCGPGSIERAHQPDEWIGIDELDAGRRFVSTIIDGCRR